MNTAASTHPSREALEIVELVLAGALPQPPDLDVDLQLPSPAASGLTIEDAEGTPVAVLGGDGRLVPVRPFTHPPLRSRRRSAAQVAAELTGLPGGGPVLAVPVTGPLTSRAVDAVLDQARAAGARLLWIAVFGAGRPRPLPAEGLWRAVQALAASSSRAGLPGVTVPVAVPVLEGGPDLVPRVALGYGGDLVAGRSPLATDATDATNAADAADGPEVTTHPAFAAELARAARAPHHRGVTVFFTGLSGSGKSTIAKQFTERLLDDGRRTVTLLDGDEVRRLLSHGLGFSRADRDLNILRIGFVATEVTRHGGVAVCAPIAPFAQVRAQVRAAVEEVGELVLVHVSTPLAECERRDRKGLYARARRGEIADFTGISSPYEVPTDADLRIDTTDRGVAECVQILWRLFERRGYLEVSPTGEVLECDESIG